MARKDAMTSKSENMTRPTETAEFTEFVPNDERVRFRAYEIYCARCHNGGNGDALTDWIAAERELKAGVRA